MRTLMKMLAIATGILDGNIFDSMLVLAYFVLGLAMLALLSALFYWTVKFIVTVPKYLKRIAEALEEIAKK